MKLRNNTLGGLLYGYLLYRVNGRYFVRYTAAKRFAEKPQLMSSLLWEGWHWRTRRWSAIRTQVATFISRPGSRYVFEENGEVIELSK
jgi:hypothetical protein